METLDCPYCECQTEVDSEDLDWEEDGERDFKCPRCEKIYTVKTRIKFYFICEEKEFWHEDGRIDFDERKS